MDKQASARMGELQRRPGNRVTIIMRVEDPIKLCIKLRGSPGRLGLENPYQTLVNAWDDRHSEWTWDIPTAGEIPDLKSALGIAIRCGR